MHRIVLWIYLGRSSWIIIAAASARPGLVYHAHAQDFKNMLSSLEFIINTHIDAIYNYYLINYILSNVCIETLCIVATTILIYNVYLFQLWSMSKSNTPPAVIISHLLT